MRASEPSRIYYLTKEDERRIDEFFPKYKIASRILRRRSFLKSDQRNHLFEFPPEERVIWIDLYFRSLLRAPIEDLATFLA